MAKIIAIQSIGGRSANFGIPAYPRLALGQTYEVATALATDLINKGFAIYYSFNQSKMSKNHSYSTYCN
ncbi:hypothetical protein [Bacillus velezensis]|uniref:hypothetical protein n=1 Tax=Bacillus velezensis TaxID=492670 RepID=UPI0005EB9BF8|nr:hypothetical protein [Bacillus velezensis]KJR69828.1 hypothetical protein BAGR45_05850 [Bacillus velezensis]